MPGVSDGESLSIVPVYPGRFLVTTIVVTAAIIERDGRFLVTRRQAGVHLAGVWEFPGGKRECDESFESCLSRELLEELGIEVAVGELIETVEHDYPGKRVLLKFFRCRWVANEPRALGCPAFEWIAREDLARYEFPAADARLIEKLRSHNDFWR